MSVEPTQFVQDHAPWSISKVKTAQNCPKQFYLTYIEKSKKRTPNSDALVGNTVHSILEFMIMGRTWDAAFDGATTLYKLSSTEIDRVLDMYANVHDFIRRLNAAKQNFNVQKVLIEKKYAVGWDGNKTQYADNKSFLRGIMDLGLLLPSPTLIILDHKSGKIQDLKWYQAQFDSYLLLAKANMPYLEKARCGIHFVAHGNLNIPQKMYDLTNTQKLLNHMISYVNKATEKTHQFDKPNVGKLCPWCDHRLNCDAYAGSNNNNGGQKINNQR